MLSNVNSRIDPMSAPAIAPSKKRSVNLFTATEIEVDALSFERVGVNTINPKDKACVTYAYCADSISCLGEIRALCSLVLTQVALPTLGV